MRTTVLKDRKSICSFFLLLFFFFTSFLYSCKSMQSNQEKEIYPISLLDPTNTFYIVIPVQENRSLCNEILLTKVEGLTKKNAEDITQYIKKMYVGIKKDNQTYATQVAASGNFPTLMEKMLLTEKNGWIANKYNDTKYMYYTKAGSDLSISLPNSKIVCYAKDVSTMIERYISNEKYSIKPEHLFLVQNSNDILFYLNNPGNFLFEKLNFPIIRQCTLAYGKIQNTGLNKVTNQSDYLFSCTLKIENSVYMKPLLTVVKLATASMNAVVYQVDDTTIEIKEMKLSQEQIMYLLFGNNTQSN